MRRPSRFRRWFKWAGVTVYSLLLVMWVFSIWGYVVWQVRVGNLNYQFILNAHLFVIAWTDIKLLFSPPLQWRLGSYPMPHYLPELLLPKLIKQTVAAGISNAGYCRWFMLPMWIPLLIVAIPTAFLFWRDRRILGYCQKCDYNLTGNTSGICPECGEKIPMSM
jgi:hypothetical protein